MVQPDNFSLYQPLVAGSLWLAARGLRGSTRSFVLAGLLAGLATLSRNDGVLVLAVLGATFLWDRLRKWRAAGGHPPRPPRISWAAAIGCVVLFALAVGPWYVRQLAVFGSLVAVDGVGPRPVHPRHRASGTASRSPPRSTTCSGMGIGPLLMTRLGGLVAAITIFSVLVGVLLFAPFMVVGGWRRRWSIDFGPFLAYAILLFGFSAIVSAIHVPGGTFIHSAVALAPHGYVLALEGIVAFVAWIATRRRHWDAPSAARVFIGGAVAFGVIASLVGVSAVHASWANKRSAVPGGRRGARRGRRAGRRDRVMAIDASGVRYWTGHPGVVLVERSARHRRAGRATPTTSAGSSWSPTTASSPCARSCSTTSGRRGSAPILCTRRPTSALYPVCTDPADTRCATAVAVR